jgi:hypothetical protein
VAHLGLSGGHTPDAAVETSVPLGQEAGPHLQDRIGEAELEDATGHGGERGLASHFDLPPDLFTVDRSEPPNALPAANEHEQADFRRQVADDVVALLGVGEGEARAAGLTRHLSCQDACFVTDGDSSAVVRHAISAL